MINNKIKMLKDVGEYEVQSWILNRMTFERKSRAMPPFGRSSMYNYMRTGGSGGVLLLFGKERIPIRWLLLS